jgi:hypothetical protein
VTNNVTPATLRVQRRAALRAAPDDHQGEDQAHHRGAPRVARRRWRAQGEVHEASKLPPARKAGIKVKDVAELVQRLLRTEAKVL